MSKHTEIRGRASLEQRALTETEKTAGYIGAIRGVVPYNSDSEVLHKRGRTKPFIERIAPDAFKRSLEDQEVMAFAGHTDDPLSSLGRLGENLTVTNDERSLTWEALVPDTAAGRDMLSLVSKKIIRGTSFEFELLPGGETWETRDAKTDQRTITSAKLLAFNPVAWPAYSDSTLTVDMRSKGRHGAEDDVEDRGTYYRNDGIVDYWDPTITVDVKFAGVSLSRSTYAMLDALEYLRAAPEGALAAQAKAEVVEATARAKAMIDFLAANGAQVNVVAMDRVKSRLAEARSVTHPEKPTDDFQITGAVAARLGLTIN